jgi:hypothetical protein
MMAGVLQAGVLGARKRKWGAFGAGFGVSTVGFVKMHVCVCLDGRCSANPLSLLTPYCTLCSCPTSYWLPFPFPACNTNSFTVR